MTDRYALTNDVGMTCKDCGSWVSATMRDVHDDFHGQVATLERRVEDLIEYVYHRS